MAGQHHKTQISVPSSDSRQSVRETEARRGVPAVLLREPGARQERPSVRFSPGRYENGPDWGDVSAAQSQRGPAHGMARPPATASLGGYPWHYGSFWGGPMRHNETQPPLVALTSGERGGDKTGFWWALHTPSRYSAG